MSSITAIPRASGARLEVHMPEITRTIWFEWDGPPDILGTIEPLNANYSLLAALPVAMKRGSSLHVRGKVDTALLENVERYTQIWAQWRPDKYKAVKVSADVEVNDEPHTHRRSWTYPLSGGVDSMFSVFRNRAGHAGRENRAPGSVFLVRGFDFPLSDSENFPRLEQRVSTIARALNLPMLVCSTNWKDFCIQYELDTQLGLAAVAHTLSATHTGASIAADFTFGEDLVVMPWGNNQYMSDLLGSTEFEILGAGADTTRIGKIEYLSTCTGALEMLCVCRAPTVSSALFNCGSCEKCIRTAMGLYVANGSVEPTFKRRPSPWQIHSVSGLSRIELVFWADILRRTPRQDRLLRAAIIALKVRSHIGMGFNALLQPFEKRYIRPFHARLRQSRRRDAA